MEINRQGDRFLNAVKPSFCQESYVMMERDPKTGDLVEVWEPCLGCPDCQRHFDEF